MLKLAILAATALAAATPALADETPPRLGYHAHLTQSGAVCIRATDRYSAFVLKLPVYVLECRDIGAWQARGVDVTVRPRQLASAR